MFQQIYFQEKLKEARQTAGLSLPELSVKLGTTPETVAGWESGAGLPDCHQLCLLSELFSLSTDYLLGVQPLKNSSFQRDPRCYYKEVEIRFADCDRKKKARIQTILKIMADIAGVAYAARGYSHEWLWRHNSVFLITRAAIRIHRMPEADETVIVETWEVGIKGVQYYRDFCFYDQKGKKIVDGQTAWVVVDPISHVIQRPSAFPGHFEPIPDKMADTLPPNRLKAEGNFSEQGKRTIVYSDIDGNRHTYNAVYAGISCDYLPQELLDRELADFRINFKQEAMLGETLSVQTCVEGNRALVIGMLGDVISYEAEFIFKED